MDSKNLSKTVSYALRHAPQEFGLKPDPEGWVFIDDLLASLGKHSRKYAGVTESTLQEILDNAEKKRWEIVDGYIRALYGHSYDGGVQKPLQEPPECLLHGTNAKVLPIIRENGLSPMNRQYVHLSTEMGTAQMVGGRRTNAPIILTVRAREAFQNGIGFYHGNQDTWLSEPIPPKFIDFPE